jgi:hypothetical protein
VWETDEYLTKWIAEVSSFDDCRNPVFCNRNPVFCKVGRVITSLLLLIL